MTICPNCGQPVSTHEMFNPPRCPVVRLRWPLDTEEAVARTYCAVNNRSTTQCSPEDNAQSDRGLGGAPQ